MIEPREALFAHLAENLGVRAVVGERVFSPTVPVGVKKPLIVLHAPISRVPRRDLKGVAYKQARLQVTAMGKTQKQAEDAANAVMVAVDGFSGAMADELHVLLATVDNDRQVAYEDISEIHHHVDVIIRYKE